MTSSQSIFCQLPTVNCQLAVGFVTPAFFIAGLALASIPIIIHILNRRRYKTVQWAAMDFLLRAMRRNRRRLKFEQWLLLAARCLLLLLAGLALSRPFGCEQSTIASIAGTRSGLHVLVIDNSYSMDYQAGRPDAKTHLDQAKSLAKQLVGRLSSGGESVVLITAARPAAAVISAPTYDLDAAIAAIDRIEQTAGGTDLVGALQKAREIGEQESSQPRRELVLFTDATQSAWQGAPRDVEALKQLGPELAKVFEVVDFNLGKPNQSNAATLALRPGSALVTSKFNADIVARFASFGSGDDAAIQWRVDDKSLPGTTNGKLEGDVEKLHPLPGLSGGPHVISASVSANDRLAIDDTRYRVINVASGLKVLIVEGESGGNRMGGSGTFLSLALAPPRAATTQSSGSTDSYVRPELISELELGTKVLGDYRAVILAGVGSITPGQADQLKLFVEQGGTLMIFMGEQVRGDNYNAMLLPRGLLPGPMTKRVIAASDQRAFTFDFKPSGNLHPVLEAFRGVEKSGLDAADIYSYWQVDVKRDSGVERVLNFVSGSTTTTAPANKATSAPAGPEPDPAITLQSVGEGHVVFVATAANADPEWTFLPVKPVYVALVHELLLNTVTPGDTWLNLTVGDRLQIPTGLKLATTPMLKDTSGKEIILEESRGEDGRSMYRSRPITQSGVYALETGTQSLPVAVNVPSDEADVRTLNDAAIKRALGDIEIQTNADSLPPEAVSVHDGDDFGWPIMLAVLMLVGLEAFMAMRFGHYRRTAVQT